ncbi:MAG: hypothetical protein RLZ80_834, partial [Actinomycetota bacterium]
MGLVNTVVPLKELEAETVQWAREMLQNSPLALRLLKAGLNAADDGLAGVQQLAGDATLLFYKASVMLNEILATLQVLSLPTRTNFRSVTKREVAIFKGPNGWGEFSPFLEYEKEEASYWLGAGIEAAFGELPKLQRDEIEINATLPAVDSEIDVERILNWYPGAKVVKIKVGDNLEADTNRIQNAINFYEDFKIRLDVNGGWSVKQAEDSIA